VERGLHTVPTRQGQRHLSSIQSAVASPRLYSTETDAPEEASYTSSPKETAAVRKRVEEELLLKDATLQPLASHRRPAGKVPYEDATGSDGAVRHPSGFVVPAPGEAPIAYADVRARPAELLSEGFADNVRRFADLQAHATAETEARSEKVPQEFHIADGTVAHPSGFVPPSPQMPAMEEVKDHYKPAMEVAEDEVKIVGDARSTSCD